MKIVILTLSLFLLNVNHIQADTFKIGVASSMAKLKKEQASFDKITYLADVSVDMAKDEAESFQLVILPIENSIEKTAIQITGIDKLKDKITINWFEMGFTKCGQSDYSSQEENWVPDVLFTKDVVSPVKLGEFQPLWIRVKTSPETKEGNYTAQITCTNGGVSKSITVNIRVRNFTIPRPGTLAAPFGSYKGALGLWYYDDRTKFTTSQYKEWNDMIYEYRMTPKEVGTDYALSSSKIINQVTGEREITKVDLSLVKEVIRSNERTYTDYSFGFYRLPNGSNIKDIVEKNTWEADPTKIVRAIPKFWEEWKKEGLPEKVYLYGVDEPHNDIARDAIVGIYQEVRKINPEWKIMQTGNCNIPELIGLVDIWCPISNLAWRPFFQERLAEGDVLWQYVCITPKYPYANFFIDEPGTNHRNLFWQTRKINATGFLYWSTMWAEGTRLTPTGGEPAFPDVPWDHSQSKYLGGDGLLMYPGKDYKPIPSARIEIIRDGIEDYEYFSLLEKLIKNIETTSQNEQIVNEAKLLLAIPDEICSSPTDYTTDESLMLEHRKKLADAIEVLAPYVQGTVEFPFLISTKEGFMQFVDDVNNNVNTYKDQYIRLENNIDLDGVSILPIGGGDTIMSPLSIVKFKGTFDGNGNSVSNFKIELPNTHYVGLFGYAENATIKSLSILNATMDGENYVGGIVGYASKTTIEDCRSNILISGKEFVGGIAGAMEKGNVLNCITEGNVYATGSCVGGSVGLIF